MATNRTKTVRISRRLEQVLKDISRKNDITLSQASDKIATTLNKINGKRLKLYDEFQF